MTLRQLAAALAAAVVTAGPAAAAPHKLLVLQSESWPEGRIDGRIDTRADHADPALRAKIDAEIARLAAAAEPLTTIGELTFTDASTAVGCKAEAPACKDDVLAMLAVDEIVITTLTPRSGGTEITVRRVVRGSVRDATMLLPTGASPDRLDGIAPLFGNTPAAAPPALTQAPAPEPAKIPAPAAPLPRPEPPAPAPSSPPTIAAPPAGGPVDQVAPAAPSQRLAILGMAGGGGMLVLGMIFWGAASSAQDDINKAPTSTRQDLAHLKDLESRGDAFATAGNVLAIGGAVLGGVATYLFLRDRGSSSSVAARLAPAVMPHGAGVVLTLGGLP